MAEAPELIVRDFILEDETVLEFIDKRFYPQRIPSDTKETSMTYFLVSTQVVGSSPNDGSCYWSRVQVGLWSLIYEDLKQLRDAVIARVKTDSRFSFQINPDTYEDESEFYSQPIDILVPH